MKSKVKLTALATIAILACCAFSLQATAQADSTSGNKALRGRPVVPLQNQERETPVTNNITQVTQVSSGMDGAYSSQSANGGYSVASAYASCGGGKVVSGGVSCGGYAVAIASEPNGNGWYGVCSRTAGNENGYVSISTTAICVP